MKDLDLQIEVKIKIIGEESKWMTIDADILII